MSTPMPVELRFVRVVLFIITGLGMALFYVLIVREADTVTLMMGFCSYIGQGFATFAMAMLLRRGGTWLLYTLWGYAVLMLLWGLVNIFAGDFSSVLQLVLPGVVLYLTTRPDARAYLRRTH